MPKKEKDIELYDFLYEDKNRISLYFSQLFEGLLREIEISESSEKEKIVKGSLGISQTKTGADLSESLQKNLKEKKEPLDIITLKLFEKLEIPNLNNFENAQVGDLFIEYGDFYLVPKDLVKSIYDYIFEVTEKMKKLTGKKFEKELKRVSKFWEWDGDDLKSFLENSDLIKPFIEKLSFETLLIFIPKDKNIFLIGTVIEDYLKDSLTSYYLKYGGKLIPNVYLIGIKDYKPKEFYIDDSFLAGISLVFEGIKEMIVPQNHELVTPIVLFRKITP